MKQRFAAMALAATAFTLPAAMLAAPAEAAVVSTEAGTFSVAASATPDRIVLNPTANPVTSQSITWRTTFGTFTGQVEYRVDGSEKVTVKRADKSTVPLLFGVTPARHHSATLTGLSADTTYEYRVGNSAGWSAWQTFTTAKDHSESFKFLYFGDAQKGLADVWPKVAQSAYAANPDAELTIAAGDMINDSQKDQQWAEWFAGIPQTASNNLVTTPGNHEYTIDPLLAQYRGHFEYPANGPAVRNETAWFTDYQGVRFISLDANAPLGGIDQAVWLERVLRNNPNNWTVVTFHQPIFSASTGRDNLATRTVWLPILEKYNVDLVLQGHDHAYARGHLVKNETAAGSTGPVYVVSNAGSKHYDLAGPTGNNWDTNGARRVVGAEGVSTFQSIEVSADRLVYRSTVAHARDGGSPQGAIVGDTLDAFTISKDSNGAKRVVNGS